MSWFEERFENLHPARLRLDCSQCGRSMWFPPSKFGKYTTCGGSCAEARYAKMNKRKAVVTPRGPLPPPREWNCAHCHKPMLGGRPTRLYCGTSCLALARIATTASLIAARTRQCAHCGGAFVVKKSQIDCGGGRFCSRRCAFDAGAHSRLFDPEVVLRAVEHRRAVVAAHKLGPESPNWKGGREAALERIKPKQREWQRAYRKANPHLMREFRQRRQGRAASERLPRGTVKRLGELQRWKCAVCAVDVRRKYHLDHIQPLARGGAHVPRNLQLLCPPCNVRKSAKDPVEFMQSRGFLL